MEFVMQAETNYNHIIYMGKANIVYIHTCSRDSVTRALVIKANCSSIKKIYVYLMISKEIKVGYLMYSDRDDENV